MFRSEEDKAWDELIRHSVGYDRQDPAPTPNPYEQENIRLRSALDDVLKTLGDIEHKYAQAEKVVEAAQLYRDNRSAGSWQWFIAALAEWEGK